MTVYYKGCVELTEMASEFGKTRLMTNLVRSGEREPQVPGEQEWLNKHALTNENPGSEAVDYPMKARRMQTTVGSPKPIMQTDCYKSFYMHILQFGLNYAYHMQTQLQAHNDHFKYTKTKKPKHVTVVGAGPLLSWRRSDTW